MLPVVLLLLCACAAGVDCCSASHLFTFPPFRPVAQRPHSSSLTHTHTRSLTFPRTAAHPLAPLSCSSPTPALVHRDHHNSTTTAVASPSVPLHLPAHSLPRRPGSRAGGRCPLRWTAAACKAPPRTDRLKIRPELPRSDLLAPVRPPQTLTSPARCQCSTPDWRQKRRPSHIVAEETSSIANHSTCAGGTPSPSPSTTPHRPPARPAPAAHALSARSHPPNRPPAPPWPGSCLLALTLNHHDATARLRFRRPRPHLRHAGLFTPPPDSRHCLCPRSTRF